MIKIRKGLNLPISGAPKQNVAQGNTATKVALVGDDYVGLRPTLEVQVGDRVKLGQLLFTDKKSPGVRYTSPGCGVIKELNRGAKRKFESLVIELNGDDEETFESYSDAELSRLEREKAQNLLLESGMWTAFRTRPFSKVPAAGSSPRSIFVTAMDTNPLAADPAPIIAENESKFVAGLRVLTRLTDGSVFVCHAPGASVPGGGIENVRLEEFGGPHPAGLPGTHIHFLDPVCATKTAWSINYQDVSAIGHLFLTGKIDVTRIVSLAGPPVKDARLIRTRIGASLDDVLRNEVEQPENAGIRQISGSVLGGRHAAGTVAYLGRHHLQISALVEGTEREFLGWQKPGFDKFSIKKIFASALSPTKKFDMTTSTGGSVRAIVPIGTYEKVMPLDIEPNALLKSLIVRDTEAAQQLGALELDEEDLALCTFVCPGKYEYAEILRDNLTRIEQEG